VYLPWNAAALHVVGQGHIIGPHVELPLDQAQYAAVHPSSVDANSHVHIYGHYLSHQTAKRERERERVRERRVRGNKSHTIQSHSWHC